MTNSDVRYLRFVNITVDSNISKVPPLPFSPIKCSSSTCSKNNVYKSFCQFFPLLIRLDVSIRQIQYKKVCTLVMPSEQPLVYIICHFLTTIRPISFSLLSSIKLLTRANPFSIVATQMLFFFRLFIGGKCPLPAAYSSTKNSSCTANGDRDHIQKKMGHNWSKKNEV